MTDLFSCDIIVSYRSAISLFSALQSSVEGADIGRTALKSFPQNGRQRKQSEKVKKYLAEKQRDNRGVKWRIKTETTALKLTAFINS